MRKLQVAVIFLFIMSTICVAFSQESDGNFDGIYGTDVYNLYVDAYGPKVQSYDYIPARLYQFEVWTALGPPTYYTPGQNDLYILPYGNFFIYYYGGLSTVIVSLPNHMY